MVWDLNTQEWKPRWGYNRVNDEKDQWILPAKSTDKIGSDPFLERREEKREKITKQKGRQLRNVKEAEKKRNKFLPGVVSINNEAHKIMEQNTGTRGRIDRGDLVLATDIAHKSTASIGKFDQVLPGQKKEKR